MEEPLAPASSQASSHFPLEPVSGAVLFRQEVARREGLRKKGRCGVGCREVDEYVLLGGLERGTVVGISAEEEEMGMLMGLQTVASLLAKGVEAAGGTALPRVMVVTTMSAREVLPLLRDVVSAQLEVLRRAGDDVGGGQVRRCLEQVSLSRVFDVAGLWEVLGEIDLDYGDGGAAKMTVPESDQGAQTSPPGGARPSPQGVRSEILDSEDEGGFSSPESSRGLPQESRSPGPSERVKPTARDAQDTGDVDRKSPDIILITHMSSLLTAFFTQRDKPTAHTMLQLLASHLRYITRSPEHGGPLVLILNSTTSSSPPQAETTTNRAGSGSRLPDRPPDDLEPPLRMRTPNPGSTRPLDPTLRSIFNPPPLPVSGLPYGYDTPLSRRNKPSFGLVFTQLLDLHLLCTRVPRAREDAEALFALPPSTASSSGQSATSRRTVEYAWVVEVLQDEIGAWEGEGPVTSSGGGPKKTKGRRISREQRWGAVDVRKGEGGWIGIVDAFERVERRVGEVRLAAGFGGRRV